MLTRRIPWYFRVLAWFVMTSIIAVVCLFHLDWNVKSWLNSDLIHLLVFSLPILLLNLSFDSESEKFSFWTSLICRIWAIIWIFNPIQARESNMLYGLIIQLILMFILSSFYRIFRGALNTGKSAACYDILTFVLWIISFVVSFFLESLSSTVIIVFLVSFVGFYLIELFSYTKIGSSIFGGICQLFTGKKSRASSTNNNSSSGVRSYHGSDQRKNGGNQLSDQIRSIANYASQSYSLSYYSSVDVNVSSWVGANEIRFTFSGTVHLSSQIQDSSQMRVIQNEFRETLESISSDLTDEAESIISDLREQYKGYDNAYSIRFRSGNFRTIRD